MIPLAAFEAGLHPPRVAPPVEAPPPTRGPPPPPSRRHPPARHCPAPARPPPLAPSARAAPEASWAPRKTTLRRTQAELFYGYSLSAGTMVPEETGPAAPDLARPATASSCRHDPVRAFAPVLTAMTAAGIPLG